MRGEGTIMPGTDGSHGRHAAGQPPPKGRKICLLPDTVINQIAAGEVVERPASVVKELLENAIDAQSCRIDVDLEDGGRRLIRVQDDGTGISPEDMSLAFHGHATSKLSRSEDLFAVRTMGFRGEALSSIGSVSQSRIVSRIPDASAGAEVAMNAGVLTPVKTCGAPQGTLVEVRNLFCNVPVRRKFLRTVQTELAHCMEAVTRIALARPNVAFRARHNRRESLRLPSVESVSDRIKGLFGADLAQSLLPVEAQSDVLRCLGFVTTPAHHRANARMQYVFLNGRYIRDRLILRAIADAYRGLLMTKRFPMCFLFLEMDARRVDVNVHPTKIEVRFRNPGAVYSAIQKAVQSALRPRARDTSGLEGGEHPQPPPSHREELRQALGNFFSSQQTGASAVGKATPAESEGPPDVSPAPVPSTEKERPPLGSATPIRPHLQPAEPPSSLTHSAAVRMPPRFCQTHNAYIIEETQDGISITDQHALHERILYEELKVQARESSVLRQRLLVPETVELSPREFQIVLALQEQLARFGIEVAEFGANAVAIQALPQILHGASPAQLLADLVDALGSGVGDGEPIEHTDRILQAIACKAAVKAGQRLSSEQIEALLERRARLALPPTCPHGRPISLFFPLQELEKRFRRK